LLRAQLENYSEERRYLKQFSIHTDSKEKYMRSFVSIAFLVLVMLISPLAKSQQQAATAPVPEIAGVPQAALTAAASIDPARIKAHVRFLSLDLLEGRGPGTRGDSLAAEYIVTQYALAGLKPAGDNGTYFQRVPLYAVHTDEEKTKFAFVPPAGQPVDLAYGTQIVSKDQTGQASATIDAPIVFVGYGINAPEYKWNDYQGVDIKGKIALVIVNEPPSDDPKFFNGKALTYYGRWTYKYEEAARRGAVGVLIIHREDLASYPWDVVRNSQAIEKSYLEGDPTATLRAAAWIQHDVGQRLLTMAGLGNVDQEIEKAGKRGFNAVELHVKLRAQIQSEVRRYNSTNVIGKVEGAAQGEQAVLYSSHYDHLGIDKNAKGDNIYNGAVDNGTGCGMLLELARAFAQASTRPPHDFYFAAVTAEEQGLLGSQYLGMHPPIPASHFSLDLNYDALMPLGIPLSANVTGAERTDFWPTVERVAKAFNLQLMPDSNPMAGYYYRSDHFSLARYGIPAFSIDEGSLFEGHPPEWGREQQRDYTAHNYHQPSDEFHEDWDFRGDARMAQFGFVLGWLASEQAKPVEWKPGDEFEAARKASKSQ
jgi:Zn-dependent M28 family amino/carboxypeptidase